jgi:phosphoribosylanthranilate isomerase
VRTRVKICGITRIEDAQAAAAAGADAIGLVFVDDSPRCVSTELARTITQSLPPFVTIVGLFVDAPTERVREAISQVRFDLLQFHGAEPAQQCRSYNLPYVKAVHMQDNVNIDAMATRYTDAAGLVFDTYAPTVAGGSGRVFDWTRIPKEFTKPVILAGGLTPENVAEAIREARPYAVDVSSGVEQGKGVKDPKKIQAFIEAVRGTAA